MNLRRFAFVYFASSSLGVCVWWTLLLIVPSSRQYFKTADSPDSTLLAFLLADLVLFAGTAGGCAFGIFKEKPWAKTLALLHAGAAGYAALYCFMLTLITNGQAWLACVMMMPSLFVPGVIIRKWGKMETSL